MELLKNNYKIKCELGICKNNADYSIHLSRCGIKSRIHICKDCMKELHSLFGNELKAQRSKKQDGKIAENKGAEDDAR